MEAVAKEGLAATLLPGREPDQMGQRHSLRPGTSSIVPGCAKERVLMLYFNTNVGASLIRLALVVPCWGSPDETEKSYAKTH